MVGSCWSILARDARADRFLTTTHRDIPERHRSLRAVFENSWQLLSREEQRAFARLSIFRGSFSREAIIEVTGSNLTTVAMLVDKSLPTANSCWTL